MANFAESAVLEHLLKGEDEEAKKIVDDMFRGELEDISNILEKYERLVDDKIEQLEKEKN